MFEQEFYDFIHSHVEVALKSQNDDFAHELFDVQHSAKTPGTWSTEQYYTKVLHLLRKHASRRLDILYQTLYRIILTRVGKLDHEINIEIVRLLTHYAEPQKEHLGQFLPQRRKELSIWGWLKSLRNLDLYRHPEGSEWRDELDVTIDNCLKQYEQSLNLLLVEQQHQRQTGMSDPSITITGSVGFIQTGDRSFAISTQKNIQPVTRDINDALRLVEDGVAQARSDLSPSDMADIMESVAKCRSELDQRDPNPVNIGSMLAGIAQAIQTTAALQPAYDAINWCLSLLKS